MDQPTGAIRVKVCGLTRKADIQKTIQAGVDAIGLVFYPPSPRHVTLEQAESLTADLPPFVSITGLFVNASRQEIEEACRRCRLDLIQLHGDEPPEACLNLPRRVIKAVRVGSRADLVGLEGYPVSGLLLDAKVKGVYGGSGTAFDWSLLSSYRSPAPLILAGGLNPDNIADAIHQVRPYAVDVSSGVESAPGMKSPQKVLRFIQTVKQGPSPQYH
ncbi:MAG: phosphoribosylanthranilate isomerase [Magnetococcales bacterium]|nr:phosphoribosylanthranilate isomerase [Magnetococcales bacterium]